MQILIVGCGKVGATLATELSKENHEIYVLDTKEDVVRNISTAIDCMGVIGEAIDLDDLKSANVEKCDLLLAMTSSDETNMLCCLFAKKINPQIKTIARVRDPKLSENLSYIKDELGLTSTVNPEKLTAREISKIILLPAAMEVEAFSRKRVQMVTFDIKEGNILANKRIMDVSRNIFDNIVLIGIQRGNEVIIPKGDSILSVGDKLSILSTPYNISVFFAKIGMVKKSIKSVMIVGGSRTAVYLANSLISSGISVKIIDRNVDVCNKLAETLPEAEIINADGTEANLLIEEGVRQTDAFVSLTGVDETNIMLSLYVGTTPDLKTITKVDHVSYGSIMNKLDLGSVISPRTVTASQIIAYVRGMSNASRSANINTLYRVFDNKAEVISFSITKVSKITNMPLKDLKLKNSAIIGTIIRDEKAIIPTGNDEIKLGDMVLVATTEPGLNDIEGILA